MTCEDCGREIPPGRLSVGYDFLDPDMVVVEARCDQCGGLHSAYVPAEDFYLERQN